jgi:hypothetical protein
VRLLGATQRDFRAVHPVWVDRQVRHYLIALPYLLGCFTDLRLLGNYKRVALAEKVFGPARVQAIVTRVATVLDGWGYQNVQAGRAFPRILCETLLLNRSPQLHDLSPALFDDLRRTAGPEKHSGLHQLQRALAALGIMDAPEAPVVPRPAVEGVAPSWQSWAHRWDTTSTLTAATRRHVRLCLLKAGRWLAAEHPGIQEPAAWTRELCAAYVAAVDRMRVGSATMPNAAIPSGSASGRRSRRDRRRHTSGRCASSFGTGRNGAGSPAASIRPGPSPRPAPSRPSSARPPA